MQKVEGGWLSRVGILLKETCPKCEVWVGRDEKNRRVEFDGMPHSCTPAQAAKPSQITEQTGML